MKGTFRRGIETTSTNHKRNNSYSHRRHPRNSDNKTGSSCTDRGIPRSVRVPALSSERSDSSLEDPLVSSNHDTSKTFYGATIDDTTNNSNNNNNNSSSNNNNNNNNNNNKKTSADHSSIMTMAPFSVDGGDSPTNSPVPRRTSTICLVDTIPEGQLTQSLSSEDGGDHPAEAAAGVDDGAEGTPAPAAFNPHNPHGSNNNSQKLSMFGLAIIIFYNVSGGPFGCEASVRSAGNFWTLVGFLVFPLIWSLQEALMTAELGSTFPEASGGVAWVQEAFGPRAAFMSGYLGWIAGATDNAIYPVLFLDYVLEATNSADHMGFFARWLLLSTTAIVLAVVNWQGLDIVGNLAIAIAFIAMSPFLVLVVVGAFQVDPSRWFETDDYDMDAYVAAAAAAGTNPYYNTTSGNLTAALLDDDANLAALQAADDDLLSDVPGILPDIVIGGVFLRPYLNNLFWNLNSFDSAASYSGDIQGDPGKVLPKSLMWGLLITVSGYFLPLLVALGASDSSREDWVDGYLAKAAEEIVGPWLSGWIIFAAGVSNIALFQAELSADAFQLMGMADRGHLPKIFSTRSKHGTPTYGIILGTLVIIAMSVSNLDELIEMLNFNYAISLLMEYFAFIKLRVTRPELERPYRIPLNTFGCCLLLAPTLFFTFVILLLADYKTYIFAVLANAVGYGLYLCMQRQHKREAACAQYECSVGTSGEEEETVATNDEAMNGTESIPGGGILPSVMGRLGMKKYSRIDTASTASPSSSNSSGTSVNDSINGTHSNDHEDEGDQLTNTSNNPQLSPTWSEEEGDNAQSLQIDKGTYT